MGEAAASGSDEIDQFFALTPASNHSCHSLLTCSHNVVSRTGCISQQGSSNIINRQESERSSFPINLESSLSMRDRISFPVPLPITPVVVDSISIDQFFGLHSHEITSSNSSSRLQVRQENTDRDKTNKENVEPISSLFTSTSASKTSLSSSSCKSLSCFSNPRVIPFSSQTSLPSFDSHVHGTSITDHMQQKMKWGGYWEQRIGKLNQQKPIREIYKHVETYKRKEKKKIKEEDGTLKEEVKEIEADGTDDRERKRKREHKSKRKKEESSVKDETSRNEEEKESSSSSVNSSTSLTTSSLSKPSRSPRSLLFSGCVLYINGRTDCSSSAFSSYHLGSLVRLHGGSVLPHFSRTAVTHLVCENLTLRKTRQEVEAMRKAVRGGTSGGSGVRGHRIWVVRDGWVLECVKAGRRVSEEDWLVVKDQTNRDVREMMGWDELS